ncbi:exodeoxyribonuclease VII small subunit [Luteibacter aegosomatis]|jgi:exodeoxyribonuclease VII small subunit|uniref:exodeoxyribonuclease VII small subunit n=1 Tax=Luteibacter aegosomatis TaxID=2911537 RepID=UPI00119AD686|nr:exodeoxyribonuclease VII small subunit [Luteibacter aegosomatis]UPG84873.1 exodeoxyribonuclease VII small subunit [Luteibacter aegosomatis]
MPKSSDTPVPASSIAEFEHSLDELEQLVTRMEGGELSLDESLKSFERGIGLYRHCQTALEQAELRVRLLLDPESPDSAAPFDSSRTD